MSSSSHQLAAIMFTDIVGYTSLMGKDENKAVELLRLNKKLQKRLIKLFKGKWLKEMGDGILASFPTISDAVYCAGRIQKEVTRIEGLNLRIGIHQGEILVEGEEIYGDGVNIASRIVGITEAGQIWVSESVYNNIKNRAGIIGQFEGEHHLKNVDEPTRVYAIEVEEFPEVLPPKRVHFYRGVFIALFIVVLIVIFLFVTRLFEGNDKVETEMISEEIEKSIAVLPFDNFSPQKEENQYLCDGFWEEVINHLSGIQSLHVRSRSSTEQYRENRPNMIEIGQKLGVTHILEGSLQKLGNELKITTQLIDAKKDRHIWQNSYQEEMTDIFQLQSRIAKQIVEQFQITLTSEEEISIATPPTENGLAYDYYLKAKNHELKWSLKGNKDDYEKARTLYRFAETADPGFALAMVERAELYWGAANAKRSDLLPGGEIDSILILCDRAISINPNLAMAFRISGQYFRLKGDKEREKAAIGRAFELDPNDPSSIYQLANIHFNNQNYVRGLQLAHKAERLILGEPESVWNYDGLGYMYMEIGDIEEARRYWEKTLLVIPDFISGHVMASYIALLLGEWDRAYELIGIFSAKLNRRPHGLWGLYYLMTDNYEQAIAEFQKVESTVIGGPVSNTYYGMALYLNDMRQEGEKLLRETLLHLKDYENIVYIDTDVLRAAINAFLGNEEEALNSLRKSKWRAGALYQINQDMWFSNINQEQEFKNIVDSVQAQRRTVREEIARLKAAGQWEL